MRVAVAIASSWLIGSLCGGFAAWDYRSKMADAEISDLRRGYAEQAYEASEQARATEHALQASVDELSKQVSNNEVRISTDGVAVDASTGGLLDAAAKGIGRASCDPGVARRGQAAARAAALYSELLAGSQQVARELAETADRRGDAGRICEAYSDAIKGR